MILHALLTVAVACSSLKMNDDIGKILENIESVDIKSITATVSYTRSDPILDRKETRTGKLLFRKEADNKQEVALLFDSLIIGQRREKTRKHFIFSGRWMAEIDHENKQFIKRELVSPEEKSVDPLELGNGLMPLPIGQSKESVLKKFTVTAIPLPAAGPLSRLQDPVVGLHLVPKGGSDWEYIDLFYDPDTWLPVAVQTMETDGTQRISRLTNLELNVLSAEEIKLMNIETPDPKEWSVDIQPLKSD
ncbi:MAG: hypothetical protein VX436_01635 [Planctomycetota bacterium]|nr:hypothetical protein [Planctomycetota bacterium]